MRSLFKTFLFLLLFSLVIPKLLFPGKVFASGMYSCDKRFVTLINPVRGRNLWKDQSLKPILDQYNLVSQYNFSATWLLQYDALQDKQLTEQIRGFNNQQEIGVFLEISPGLAYSSRVIYPYDAAWSEPQVIFLSGYSQSERRRLVDVAFKEFKSNFGYYPKSVGAWWIDSYSLNYLKEKYGVKAALIVADQKTTDRYGVWGQWWGYPYYPSKANILTPADSLNNKQDVVILQWAQRDLSLAYGIGPKFSNNSLQANDYTSLGKDTDYFKSLTNTYLDCINPIGQITVGLETGIEGLDYIGEYKKQLGILKDIENLKSVSMNEFALKFSEVYPKFPEQVVLKENSSIWDLNTKFRSNGKLNDLVVYRSGNSFKDYFLPDHGKFLNRRLNEQIELKNSVFHRWFLLFIVLFGFFSFFKKTFKVFLVSQFFALAAYGLVLRSFYQYGWQIFLGPQVMFLPLTQILLIILSFLLILLISRMNIFKKIHLIYLIPLSFGLDPLAQAMRFSIISEKIYFGFAADDLRFIGLTFQKPLKLFFVNLDLPAYQAAALLKINYSKIWENPFLSLIMYPLIHILLAVFLGYLFLKIPKKMKKMLLVVLTLLFIWHLKAIFEADPRIVTPNL